MSLGGETNTYELTGQQEGEDFADFLWGAFGPQTAEWMDAGKPIPFDGPNGEEVQVDGFDMDIEYASTGMFDHTIPGLITNGRRWICRIYRTAETTEGAVRMRR